MPGVTKRKFDGETMRIQQSLKRPLYSVAEVLPCDYSGNDLLQLFKEYYPMDRRILIERGAQVEDKDAFLRGVGKKQLYKQNTAEDDFLGM